MKFINFIFIFLLFFQIGLAHESNKAFFNILQKEKIITIDAEFPWTIRNALIKFNPKLEQATTKKEFISTLKDYLNLNLVLIQNNGKRYDMINVKEMKKNNHSHQVNYIITFKGEDLHHLNNSLLFNLDNNQKNFHKLVYNSSELMFTTSLNNPTFKLPKNDSSIYWWSILLIAFLMGLIYYFKK